MVPSVVSELEPRLRASSSSEAERSARVVIVGSRLERQGRLDVDTLEATRGARLHDTVPAAAAAGASSGGGNAPFQPMNAYADTKHANMLLLTHLAATRWRVDEGAAAAGPAAAVFAVSPGMVDTNLWGHFPLWYRALTAPVRAVALRTPQEGAAGVVFAATAKSLEGRSGLYLADGCELAPSEASTDALKSARLFDVCARLIDLEREHARVGAQRPL